jgi:hypothetical protein
MFWNLTNLQSVRGIPFIFSEFYLEACIGCLFQFLFKVGIEKSIVNAPRITDHGSAVQI